MDPESFFNRLDLGLSALGFWALGIVAILQGGFFDPIYAHQFDLGGRSSITGLVLIAGGTVCAYMVLRRR
jgi:hypothetical protein